MPSRSHALHGSRRLAPWLAFAAARGFAACMETAATATGSADVPATGASQGEKAPAKPGVPVGCTREWSPAAGDSVLNCPDLPPPSPR